MYRPIATLNLPERKIQEIYNKGYMFIDDINIEAIQSDIGISAEDWKLLIKSSETKTALDLCEDSTSGSHIVTFSSSLDDILGGGVSVGMITEVTGTPGSGKSQLCLQLSVAVQLADCFGGIEGNCVYIDTTLGFHTNRLTEIAKGCIKYCYEVANTQNSFDMFENFKTLTEEKFLNGVRYIQINKFVELLSIVHSFKKLLDTNENIKLIIIDGITDPVKHTNLEYFDRIKLLYSLLSDLQKLSQIYKFAIVVTNDMTIKYDQQGNSFVASCLGDSFAHRMNSRIKLEHISDDIFSATLVKNVENSASVAKFRIVEAGIRDIQ